MKRILLLVLCFCYSAFQAQLDTEHWIAPMSARAGISNLQSYLYLSTNETTPFSVQLSNNNTVFSTVQVSKGNPVRVQIPASYMMATNQTDHFTAIGKGIFAKGSKKFFANYRFSVTNHAEIVTSKGLAALGTQFYAGMAPLTGTASYVNSNIGVIATEDNTTVTLSGYDPAVIFSDGIVAPTRTFTLNKGQSYIIDAVSSDSPANAAGLVGAKITSTKPISVTNGNFNGIYTNNNFTNNDILMDQAVPIDRLGNEFVMVKGNGDLNSGMETALIIATENNTSISLNGVPSGITLNAGQYYMIPSSNYINHGNNNYNMNIKADKNIYVYQFLAGVAGSSPYATGGMNFIPPLSCFLPNSVDEIGLIDEIGNGSYDVKLNIITQVGANVTLNNAPIAATNGPYPVTGNPNWVTYSIPNIYGNVTVQSTKAVTAGIAGGSGAVGFGGYFAGFSSVPAIVKTGDCFNGVLLQVDNTYDAYQWYLNGNIIPGATSYSINPELYGSGNYTVLVTKNNCDSKLTGIYAYTICPPIAIQNFNIGSCQSNTILPTFTNSTQTPVIANTQIIVQPTNGTVSINPTTGAIVYTPNTALAASTTDTFVYFISGNGNPADFEYFRVQLNINVLQVQNGSLSTCSNASGQGVFNLTTVNVSSDPGVTIAYFSDAALTNSIAVPNNYTSNTGNVYASVTSSFGCKKTATISLTVNPSPNINSNVQIKLCDNDFDGDVDVTFSSITPQVLTNTGNFNVRYYANNADAVAGNNNTLPNNWSITTNTTVYVRVDDNAGLCPSKTGSILLMIGSRITLLTQQTNAVVCDSDLNGSESINLQNYVSTFTTNASVTATFYSTLANAQSATNAINATQIISSTSQTYYIRFESATDCANIGTLIVRLSTPNKSLTLSDKEICPGQTTILDAGPGFDGYRWNTGETTQSITVGAGNFYVDLTSNGCVYRQEVKVTTSVLPTITSIETTSNSATIHVTGGTAPYSYSLNGVDYQSSNVFTGLPRGVHTIYVMGADKCSAVSKEFLILNLVNAITPNNDGKNDYLDYSDLTIKKEVVIEVVNRYGAPVFKSTKSNSYKWDGHLNGSPLPTGTYWYTIKWIEPETKIIMNYSSWLLIKNRN